MNPGEDGVGESAPGADGDWRTPKVSHVRPTVRPQHPVSERLRAAATASGGGASNDSSPGVPAQSSTPFPAVEEGPLTPSPFPRGRRASATAITTSTSPAPPAMETRVGRIEEEVKNIASLLKCQMSCDGDVAASAAHLQQENERLSRLNGDLEATLRDSEDRLSKLQEGVVSLQEEYRAESEDLLRRVAELAEAVAEEKERREDAERHREKVEKGRQSLERYLTTLPSQEEFEGLKRRFRKKEAEAEGLHSELAEARAAGRSAAGERDEMEASLKVREGEAADLRARLKSAEEDLYASARRRSEAAKAAEGGEAGLEAMSTLEAVLEERDAWRKECERTKKALVLTEAKYKKDMRCVTGELRRKRQELEEALGELESAKSKLKEETSTSGFLREDLTKARGEAAGLRGRVEALEKDLAESRHSGQDSERADRACDALAREMSRCARDLSSLSQSARLLARGEDPGVSQLLGITSPGGYVEEGDPELQSPAARLARARALLGEVKETREAIAGLRNDLSEKYAENLGDNFNSCVTN